LREGILQFKRQIRVPLTQDAHLIVDHAKQL